MNKAECGLSVLLELKKRDAEDAMNIETAEIPESQSYTLEGHSSEVRTL